MSDPNIAPHPHPKTMRFSWAQVIVSTTALVVVAGLGAANYFKVDGPTSSVNGVGINNGTKAQNPEPRPERKALTEPAGIFRFVFQGLSKARADLLDISLSCDALVQWQGRADAATRLAAANGLNSVHFTISQQLSACQNNPDLLVEMRKSLVAVLDGGIATAKERSGQ